MIFAKKSLGQNFLIDNNIIKKIVESTDIYNKDVIEIGPGKGALTSMILSKEPKSLIVIEKDESLYQELKIKYSGNKKIKVFNKDILKFNLEKITKAKSIIFGNLPYNISSQILIKIIKFDKMPPNYSTLVFMFQKEVAERIVGKYNTNNYGRLSILANYKLQLVSKFDVSPNCFYPKPKVNSTVLKLVPVKKNKYKIRNIENLEKVTNVLFSSKRKMINKSLKKILSIEQIDLLGNIDLKSRPSNLKPEKFFKITEILEGC